MTDLTRKRLTYVAGLIITGLALIPANLPFTLYLRKLLNQGKKEIISNYMAENSLSELPLTLVERFFYTFFPFILLLIVLMLIWRVLHGKKLKTLMTSAPRFRWKNLMKSALIWLLLSGVADSVQYLIRPENYTFNWDPLSWIKLIALGFIFIIPQVTLEETFFRSYLMKAGTSFLGHPLIPLIGFSLIFGLLHWANPEVKEYGPLLMMPQYIGMGLFLAYLCWESGGLELSLGIHLANNSWGILIVNGGGTAFDTPAPVHLYNWDPLISLITLSGAIFLFLVCNQWGFFIVKKKNRYYFDY